MELISTTKTYYHHWKSLNDINDDVKEYVSIIVHYDGTDMNTIKITTKDLHGKYIEDEEVEAYVQYKYIEYCIANDIPHE